MDANVTVAHNEYGNGKNNEFFLLIYLPNIKSLSDYGEFPPKPLLWAVF